MEIAKNATNEESIFNSGYSRSKLDLFRDMDIDAYFESEVNKMIKKLEKSSQEEKKEKPTKQQLNKA